MSIHAYPPLSRVLHPSFTGYTHTPLPGRYVASFHGGVITPLHYISHATHGHYYYDGAIRAIESITREHERSYCNSVSMGMWVNNGCVYFDTSTSFDDVEDALKFARDNDQLAIFDTVTKKEINVT